MLRSPERRRAPRHRPDRVRVHVVWSEGDVLRHAIAQLGDLSSGGAAVVLDEPGPDHGAMALRLEGEAVDDWVLAEIVAVVEGFEGRSRLGLRFAEGCSNRFFRKALWGTPARAPEPASSATRSDSCWSKRTAMARNALLGRDRPRDSRWLDEEPAIPPLAASLLVAALH